MATQIAKMHRRAEIAQLARDVKRARQWGPRRPPGPVGPATLSLPGGRSGPRWLLCRIP
jgi:hypothetical protein